MALYGYFFGGCLSAILRGILKKVKNTLIRGCNRNFKKVKNTLIRRCNRNFKKRFDQVRICMYYVTTDMENSMNKELAIKQLESIINRVEIINSICAAMLKDLKQSNQSRGK